MTTQPFARDAGRPPASIVPSGLDTPIPSVPDTLGERGAEAWTRLWTNGRGHLSNEAHYDLMAMLCEVIDRRGQFLDASRKARPMTKGSMGQLRVNPIFAELERMENQIADLLKRTGFEPGPQKRKAVEPRKRSALSELQRQTAEPRLEGRAVR